MCACAHIMSVGFIHVVSCSHSSLLRMCDILSFEYATVKKNWFQFSWTFRWFPCRGWCRRCRCDGPHASRSASGGCVPSGVYTKSACSFFQLGHVRRLDPYGAFLGSGFISVGRSPARTTCPMPQTDKEDRRGCDLQWPWIRERAGSRAHLASPWVSGDLFKVF